VHRSTNIEPWPGADPWQNCYILGVQNQGQISPKVTEMTDTRNTLRVTMTTLITAGQSILLQHSKPRSLTEKVPWWLISCNKFALHQILTILLRAGLQKMPGWNWSAVQTRLPISGLVSTTVVSFITNGTRPKRLKKNLLFSANLFAFYSGFHCYNS